MTDKEEGGGGGAAESGETKEGLVAEAAAGTLSGDFSGAWRPGDLRLGVTSLGSLARASALEGPGPYLVGDGIFSLESSGLGWLGLSERPGPGAASTRGSRGDI